MKRTLAILGLLGLLAVAAPAAATYSLLTPAAITATGGGLDLANPGLDGPAQITLATFNTAGTSPTLDAKLQGSPGLAFGGSYTTTGDNDIVLRNNTNDNIQLAAKWTQSGARQIKTATLRLKKNGTLAAGKKLTLTINTNSTADPSATVLGTAATVDIDTEVTTSYSAVTFTFAKPVDVADATVYWLVLSGDYDVSSSNNVTWRTTTVASGGNANVYDSAWAAVATNSREFYLYEYNFADVTGGAFTQVATALNTSVQSKNLYGPSLPPVLRLYFTIGGTSNPAFSTAAVLTGTPRRE